MSFMNCCFKILKMYLFASFFAILYLTNAAPVDKVMVDMTHVYDENVIMHPTWRNFEMKVVMNGTHNGYWVQGEEIISATHTGTHMDAPSHFTPGGLNVDQIPLSKLFAPAAVISIEDRAAKNPTAGVTVEDLENWEKMTGQSLNGTIVLMNSGWGKKWHSRTEFLGTEENDASKLRFPGFSREAAQWLVDYRDIIGIGVDTVSIDIGGVPDAPVHNIILRKGLFGIENIVNSEKIPIYGATLHVMPMKIDRASGAPTRVIATFPKVIFHADEHEGCIESCNRPKIIQ